MKVLLTLGGALAASPALAHHGEPVVHSGGTPAILAIGLVAIAAFFVVKAQVAKR